MSPAEQTGAVAASEVAAEQRIQSAVAELAAQAEAAGINALTVVNDADGTRRVFQDGEQVVDPASVDRDRASFRAFLRAAREENADNHAVVAHIDRALARMDREDAERRARKQRAVKARRAAKQARKRGRR